MKTYSGVRTETGCAVTVADAGGCRGLDPRFDLRRHQPHGLRVGVRRERPGAARAGAFGRRAGRRRGRPRRLPAAEVPGRRPASGGRLDAHRGRTRRRPPLPRPARRRVTATHNSTEGFAGATRFVPGTAPARGWPCTTALSPTPAGDQPGRPPGRVSNGDGPRPLAGTLPPQSLSRTVRQEKWQTPSATSPAITPVLTEGDVAPLAGGLLSGDHPRHPFAVRCPAGEKGGSLPAGNSRKISKGGV